MRCAGLLRWWWSGCSSGGQRSSACSYPRTGAYSYSYSYAHTYAYAYPQSDTNAFDQCVLSDQFQYG